MSFSAARAGSPPTTPAVTNHRFFTRQRRNRANLEHLGRSNAIQTFFEGPGFKESDEKWAEHAPPSLPQAKKNKHEGAAVHVYKRRKPDQGHDGFYIYKVRLQSPFLRDVLKETLETYGVTYHKNHGFADSFMPHRALFFALDKVAELAKTAEDETTRNHCELLCSVIEEIFDDDFDTLETLEKEDKITFKFLWTMYPEKSIYVVPLDGVPPRAFRVKRVVQTDSLMQLRTESIIFDGFRYGTVEYLDRCPRFEGAVPRHEIPGLRYMNLTKNPDLRDRLYEQVRRRPTEAEMQLNRRVVVESQDNLLIMPHLTFGYSLNHRTWQKFDIESLTPVEADRSVFDKVVLDEQKKDVLKTLVEGHMELTTRYDDLISGKVAEHLGCPLLRADPTSIQPDTFRIVQGYDAPLAQFLKDATEWSSLVLFDAFLRQAEYFKGIIFLTTNLGRTIDPAVLSRAQIHITFPALTEEHRALVWQNFINRVPEDVGSLTATDVTRLAKWRVNGREIKNILNMAVSWYRKKGEFSVESVETLINTICPSARREDHGTENTSSGAPSEELALLDL
ncbi:hypothetical protein B0H66DRAFT_473807 [Apodospora peruviana]|uniref:DUF7025 domain-containing protein n=1 Tax=Apodospora peruviana TaxID=516989 RepID=A0AAE0M9J5_9PEZI|nr:hypothetical protein B0H66DRAFT_473807 [Apodospora peruviana]